MHKYIYCSLQTYGPTGLSLPKSRFWAPPSDASLLRSKIKLGLAPKGATGFETTIYVFI